MSNTKNQKKISVNNTGSKNIPDSKKIQNYIYRFCDEIGKGNFSKVYKGIHQVTNQQIAIKTIQLHSLDTPRLKQLLNTETVILKMLNHKNVINCIQILSSFRNCYIIMELCNGGDLQTKLKKEGHFSEKQIYSIVLDIYDGLKYLAKKNIVHRDLKTSNVFVHNGVYKIADFGFAQVSEKQFKDISVGSPIYMSPEGFINNIYGSKTDVWALGVMLFQMVQGHTPCWDSRSQEQLKKNLHKQIDKSSFKSNVSDSYKELVSKCLIVNHKQRPIMQDLQNLDWIKKARAVVKQAYPTRDSSKNTKENSSSNIKKSEINDQDYLKEQCTNKLAYALSKQYSVSANNNRFNKALTGNSSFNYRTFMGNQSEDFTTKRNYTAIKTYNGLETKLRPDMEDKRKEQNSIFYSPKNIPYTVKQCIKKMQKNPSGGSLLKTEPKQINKFLDSQQIFSNQRERPYFIRKQEQRKSVDRYKDYITYSKESKKPDIIKNSYNELVSEIKTPKLGSEQYNGILEQKDQNVNDISIKAKQKQMIRQSDIMGALKQNSVLDPYKKYFHENKDQRKSYQLDIPNKSIFLPSKQKYSHESPYENSKTSSENPSKQPQPELKILKRILKFGDCIGIIHYCRLSYKFACLLETSSTQKEAKIFYTNWCINILDQIMLKIKLNEIVYGNESTLMNNPSINDDGPEKEKKRKLKDVTQEYLKKYTNLSDSLKRDITLKEVCNFTYDLYLQKSQQFRNKSKSNNSLYFASISYLSVLDKQTRAFMEFSLQMKNTFDGKAIEKLLTMKISDFNLKYVEANSRSEA